MSTNWGALRDIIEEEILSITKGRTPLPISGFSDIIDLMEDILPRQLGEKNRNRLEYVKNKIWEINNPSLDYTWLTKKTSRIKKYTDTKIRIKESISIDAIKKLCDGNLRIYGNRQFDKVKDIFSLGQKEQIEIVEKLVEGSRSRSGSNMYDKLHLLCCFFFSDDFVRDDLIFSTTDKPIIENSQDITLPFNIEALRSLNHVLDSLSN